jgi:metallo-beta-lactamase class B
MREKKWGFQVTKAFRWSAIAPCLIAATAMLAGNPVSAQEPSARVIPAGRQGQVDPARADSPNGGRPEIHTREDMARMAAYTAPGARAYAEIAADASNGQWPVTLYYRCKYPRGGTSINAPMPEPMEVFDDVYSLGDDANNIWAIDTEEGIILIDALTTEEDAKSIIVRNMETVGLDPRRIRYILVTHNHLDHFGGAPYLKSISGALIGASRIDWEGETAFGSMPPKEEGDFYLEDGQEITLGSRTLTAILTPGHTPGTISFVFPVTDNGTPHVAALFGGQGKPPDMESLIEFREGLGHFADATDRMQADVVLSNHTVGDDGLTKIAQLAQRQPGEPNPYVVGRDGVIRYDAVFRACLSADIDQLAWEQANDPQGADN